MIYVVPVDMIKDTDCHVVYLQMDSTKDIEFKFIVDGEWKYATDLPHRKDWRKLFYLFIYTLTYVYKY